MTTRKFPLAVVLSVTTGVLLTLKKSDNSDGMDDLYDILDFYSGQELRPLQLMSVADAFKKDMYAKHPELEQISTPERNSALQDSLPDNDYLAGHQYLVQWLEDAKTQFNAQDEYEVTQVEDGDFEEANPLMELLSAMGLSVDMLDLGFDDEDEDQEGECQCDQCECEDSEEEETEEYDFNDSEESDDSDDLYDSEDDDE